MESEDTAVVVSWSGIVVTFAVSLAQGVAFLCFFLCRRNQDKKKYESTSEETALDLYETRQHTRKHRSPEAFSSRWISEALRFNDEDTLKCVGLDSFMFLRLLRLGASICTVGTVLSIVLMPVYATGLGRGNDTIQFNRLTLARVEPGSNWRLWATLGAWWSFVAVVLYLLVAEWRQFYKRHQDFLALGDEDMLPEYRYSIRIEQVPNNSSSFIRNYFERLFPGEVASVVSCQKTQELETVFNERHSVILKLEALDAWTHANPTKPPPTVRDGFRKADAKEFYSNKLALLNEQFTSLKAQIPNATQQMNTPGSPDDTDTQEGDSAVKSETSTAFVTFKTLRSKQAAIQCELTGDPDSMVVFPASAPKSIIWSNSAVSLPRQKTLQFVASLFWLTGVLFWSVPVSFVTAISNLNSILKTFDIRSVDESSALYGLVSGLLPVVALAILMAILFMAIQLTAKSLIRYKSWPEVEKYTLFWHMLFQFANLWLILIGGSLFNQVNKIFDGSSENSWLDVVNIVANALPGASVFFVNMILVSSFGAFGLELSMIPAFFTSMVMRMLSPEASRTQRQLDDAKVPPSIVWGKQIPPTVFVFLVIFLYLPIVPLMEVFGLVYFAGMYVVWKHQCLHVYAQEFEGGGNATWQQVFPFLMACLYTGQCVFIAYMGIKQAPTQSALGFVPLVATILLHRNITRKFVEPTRCLSLEAAAEVDLKDGEYVNESTDRSPYLQPVLDPEKDEKEPLPYRRGEDISSNNGSPDGKGDVATKVSDEDNV